jgi:hypothetical protein
VESLDDSTEPVQRQLFLELIFFSKHPEQTLRGGLAAPTYPVQ